MEQWQPNGSLPVGVVDLEWLGSEDITPSEVDFTSVSLISHLKISHLLLFLRFDQFFAAHCWPCLLPLHPPTQMVATHFWSQLDP
jgi:hypothetical protein